jgi:hypothetical protein
MNHEILTANLESLQKLANRLQSALSQLTDQMPLDVENFDPDTLDDGFLLKLDGFRARFSDLQDFIGHTMIPMLCKLDEDETPATPLSTRDRNALIERKGIFILSHWQALREIRNGFTHDYPNEHVEKAMLLNAAWSGSHRLIDMAQAFMRYLHKHHHAPN